MKKLLVSLIVLSAVLFSFQSVYTQQVFVPTEVAIEPQPNNGTPLIILTGSVQNAEDLGVTIPRNKSGVKFLDMLHKGNLFRILSDALTVPDYYEKNGPSVKNLQDSYEDQVVEGIVMMVSNSTATFGEITGGGIIIIYHPSTKEMEMFFSIDVNGFDLASFLI